MKYDAYGLRANATVSRGIPFTQLYHHYPVFESLSFDFEKNFDPNPGIDYIFIDGGYTVPIVACVVYLLFIFLGEKIMKDRKPFDLLGPLAAWNLFLAVFSIYGATRTVPHLLFRIATYSFERTICEAPHTAYGTGVSGLASQLFILSKIPELVDTVFIVLRKKPLIFLHWYHHVTVLLFCWNSYMEEAGAGIWFIAMNYFVHAVMYSYYFGQTVKMVPKWFPSWIITLFQISQMIVGTFIVCSCIYMYFFGGSEYGPGECLNSVPNLLAGAVIYGSYLYLFVDFALRRFVFKGNKQKTKKSA